MGEALIIRKGIEKVTIDGEKVKSKMNLEKISSTIYLPPVPQAVFEASGIVIDGEFHRLGGRISGTSYSLMHYKFSEGTWTAVSTMGAGVCGAPVVVFNDELYVLGGKNSSGVYRLMWKYSNGAWTQLTAGALKEVSYSSAVVFNNKIHWIGGVGNNIYYATFDGNILSDSNLIISNCKSAYITTLKGEMVIIATDTSYNWKLYKIADDGTATLADTIKQNTNYSLINATILSTEDEIHLLGITAGDYSNAHLVYDGVSLTQLDDLPVSFSMGCAYKDSIGIHLVGGTGVSAATTDHLVIDTNFYAEVSE